MGKPRLIILVRHAQSEGNKNRAVHQTTPDHRVKLTPQGHKQAKEAGKRLMELLRPNDTVQFYTSPYLRTRETTTGMLSQLESHPNYQKIKVYEEPRLREQDFGNFQPCAAEMERMWHERAAYGHFFYRIPNGESAADAYDRISVFNESLWRQFAEDDFASVLVLVTHGLMTRVFLMKWYHYSVEYFEDLRNVNHCEFIHMERNDTTGKYILQSQLRTWSAYKKEQEAKRLAAGCDNSTIKDSMGLSYGTEEHQVQPPRRWGGCVNGCNHAKYKWFTYGEPNSNAQNENYGVDPAGNSGIGGSGRGGSTMDLIQKVEERLRMQETMAMQERHGVLEAGRDFGGSRSGAGSDVDDSGSGGEDDLLDRVRRKWDRQAADAGCDTGSGESISREERAGDQSSARTQSEAQEAEAATLSACMPAASIPQAAVPMIEVSSATPQFSLPTHPCRKNSPARPPPLSCKPNDNVVNLSTALPTPPATAAEGMVGSAVASPIVSTTINNTISISAPAERALVAEKSVSAEKSTITQITTTLHKPPHITSLTALTPIALLLSILLTLIFGFLIGMFTASPYGLGIDIPMIVDQLKGLWEGGSGWLRETIC